MKDLSGKILFATAHQSETEAVARATGRSGCKCEILTTGVGGMAMSWALQKRFSEQGFPPLIINAGIAGSYTELIMPGEVVLPVSDCFADMGVDDNGSFVSLFNANLADPDRWPFAGGRIICTSPWIETLRSSFRTVSGATVNMSSGSVQVIERIRREWDPEIETMEGAWFAYACAMNKSEYFSLRSVSNMVEPRNIKNWNIPLALEKLETAICEVLVILSK